MKKTIATVVTFFKKIPTSTKILLLLFAVLVLFTRIYNIEGTARFTQDEASDLARMRGYWLTKQITLIGPISNDGSKIFSALSYYMILPFAAAADFTPVSPAYGMVFWGIITAILLLLLTHKINKKLLLPVGLLITVWYPLVLMSRWSWNPHFVVFWATLGILSYQFKKQLGSFAFVLTGFAFGAMFHHHYLAIFTTAPFLLFISIPYLLKKQFKPVVLLFIGYVIPHLAFILFDLKNPPGLFFGRYLIGGNTPHVQKDLAGSDILANLIRNIKMYPSAFVQQASLQTLFLINIVVLATLEIKKYFTRTITWFGSGIAIIFGGMILGDFQTRFVYSSIIFILVWLLLPRKEKMNRFFASLALFILIVGSVFGIKTQLTVNETQPDMRVIRQASDIIVRTIKEKKLKNTNIAALSSPDSSPLAEKYRDYIYTRGVNFQAPSQYDVSEHLFVVSTKTDEVLREDQSYAMIAFRDKALKEIFPIGDTGWKVFWYGVNIDE